tara:strand:- start:7312 stop:8379 length:1068 start_codon:yes stop_codon:yes gene_type:complete
MHLALAALILSPLAAQDSEVRVPVPADDPVVVAEDPVLVREVPRPIAEGTRIVRYELAHLTGHDGLEPWDDRFDEIQDPVAVQQALDLLDRFEDRRIAVQETTESLMSSVRDMMVPRMEAGIQRVEHVGDGAFVLVGTPAQHAWMVQFLAAADGFDGLIDIEAQIFVLERGKLAAYTPDRSGTVLEAQIATQLLLDLKDSGADVVVSPRVMTWPFQKAELSVISQQAYVSDYELKVIPETDHEIADPVIDVVNSGLTMTIRGVPLADDRLSVHANLEYSVLERPIPSTEITIGAGHHKVLIQTPKVTRIKLDGVFAMKGGESLLLVTADPTGLNDVIVMLKADRMELPEDLAPGR